MFVETPPKALEGASHPGCPPARLGVRRGQAGWKPARERSPRRESRGCRGRRSEGAELPAFRTWIKTLTILLQEAQDPPRPRGPRLPGGKWAIRPQGASPRITAPAELGPVAAQAWHHFAPLGTRSVAR